jgi:hypothetical protein
MGELARGKPSPPEGCGIQIREISDRLTVTFALAAFAFAAFPWLRRDGRKSVFAM